MEVLENTSAGFKIGGNAVVNWLISVLKITVLHSKLIILQTTVSKHYRLHKTVLTVSLITAIITVHNRVTPSQTIMTRIGIDPRVV